MNISIYSIDVRLFKKVLLNKWILTFLITTIGFIISVKMFDNRDLNSEILVVNTIRFNAQNSNSINWFGLIFYNSQPYTSHIGLHGLIFSIPVLLGIQLNTTYIYYLMFIVGFLFNFYLISICLLLKEKFSTLGSILFFLTISLNPVVLFNSTNLYWLHFLLLIPMYYCWKHFDSKNDNIFRFYLILGCLFTLKYIATFEYISSMILACVIPILYTLLKNNLGARYFIKHILYLFLSATIPFVIVTSIFAFSIVNISGSQTTSFLDKIAIYMGIENQTSISSNTPSKIIMEPMNNLYDQTVLNINELPDDFSHVTKLRNQYKGYYDLVKYLNFDINSKLSIVYSSQMVISIMLLLVLSLVLFFKKISWIMHYTMYLFCALFASISWPLIMPVHFYLHSVVWRGISDIVLVFPFYAMSALVVGELINITIVRLRR